VITLVIIVVVIFVAANLLSSGDQHQGAPSTTKREPNSHFRDDGSPKRPYLTKINADRAARSFEKSHRGESMNAYRCATCRRFHTGHAN
jgi:hypothetical protein